MSPARQPSVFISYRRFDAAGHAGRLADGLISMVGRERVFVDVDSIDPGQNFVAAIHDALSRVDVLLVVIGRSWLTASTEDGVRRLDLPDDLVRIEIESAFRHGILVVPLLVQGALMPAGDLLPESLRPLSQCNAVMLHDAQWRGDLERLMRKLGLRGDPHQRGEAAPTEYSAEVPSRPPAGGDRVGQLIVGSIPHAAAALRSRDDLLQMLGNLRTTGRVAVVAAVTGTRGVGKTQLAAAYARAAVAQLWPVVVWIDAEHEDQVIGGLAELADGVGVRGPGSDSATAARTALRWLRSQPGPCLLVYDNAEDPDVVARWMPSVGNIQTIVTTVRPVFANLGDTVAVDLFGEQEALAYLRQRTGIDDGEGARVLAEQLGYLPLAIAQAAAVTGKGRLYPSYAAYLARLNGVTVDEHLRRVLGDPYSLGAAQALELSIGQLVGDDPDGVAEWVFDLLCVFSASGVNTSLLERAERRLATKDVCPKDTEDDAGTVRRAGFYSALALLADRSLAMPVEGDAVTVHRLIQRVGRERLDRAGRMDAVISEATAVIDGARMTDAQAWAQRAAGEHLVIQIQALWDIVSGASGRPVRVGHETKTAVLDLRVWSVGYLNHSFDVGRAIELGESVSSTSEDLLGPDHPVTLTSRHVLAEAYRTAGRLAEAIPLFVRTAADRERVVGADHPDTMTSRNCLARAHRFAGHSREAISMHERSLADRARALGGDHPDTLESRSDLGFAYWAAGQTFTAIPLLERTLSDRERILGVDHPDTLRSRNNLADMYRMAQRLPEAIALFKRSLADRVRVLGADHPDTLVSCHDLADAYTWAGRLSEAIPLLERTLPQMEHTLGAHHPDTLVVRADLAAVYESAGRLAEAIPLRERTLADSERALGSDHPETLASRTELASAYRQAGRHHEAIPLLEHALTDVHGVLGVDHKHTMTTRGELAFAYESAGRMDEAIALHERDLADRERVLGIEHPATLTRRNDLARAYRSAGRLLEAIRLHERTAVDCERTLGADHPFTLASRNDLGVAYVADGRPSEAIALLERTLADRERVLSTDHPDILTSRNNLAQAYASVGRLDEAIALFERTLADRERVLSTDHPDILRARNDLAAARSADARRGTWR